MNSIRLARKKSKVLLFGVFFAAAIIFVVGLFGASVVVANDGDSGRCHGTYFVEIVQPLAPESALWTFSEDGTFQATNSLEKELNFSHQQGAWQYTQGKNAKAVWLSFVFESAFFNASGVGRNDADIVFSKDCESLSGTFDLRFYDSELDLDPLDPADASPIGTAAFTGRRLNL